MWHTSKAVRDCDCLKVQLKQHEAVTNAAFFSSTDARFCTIDPSHHSDNKDRDSRLRRSNLSSREEMVQRSLLVRQRLGSKPENKA